MNDIITSKCHRLSVSYQATTFVNPNSRALSILSNPNITCHPNSEIESAESKEEMEDSTVTATEFENKRKLEPENEDSDPFGISRKRIALEKERNARVDESITAAIAGVPHITVAMECPAQSVGSIIGKKGANVNEIMKRSGCKIVIDQSDQRPGVPKRVSLTGPPDQLVIAMSLVTSIINDGANALFGEGKEENPEETGDDIKEAPLQSESMCPNHKVGEVIGTKGTTIAEIMRRSGCRVHILQNDDKEALERQVVYNGTLEQMAAAQALVQSVIDEGSIALGIVRPEKQSSGDSISVPGLSETDNIESDRVGTVIGAKGRIISEIMKKSGCKIIINQEDPTDSKIIYQGKKEDIDIARALVYAVCTQGPAGIAEYGQQPTTEEMDILQRQTGKILGPHGATIKEMQSRFNVKLKIIVSDSAKGGEEGALNKLQMGGTFDSVRIARLCVQHIITGGVLENFVSPFVINQPQSQPTNNYAIQNQWGQQPQYGQQQYGQQQYQQQQQYGQQQYNQQQQHQGQYYPQSLTSTGYGQMPQNQQYSQQQTGQNQQYSRWSKSG
jgi:rRNA processing protein Krr1/Pno1